jgi:predicted ArsR family transcriptional regulator
MNMRERILFALRVTPLTVPELSRFLGCSVSGVRHAAEELRASGEVREVATVRRRRMGRPELRLAA